MVGCPPATIMVAMVMRRRVWQCAPTAACSLLLWMGLRLCAHATLLKMTVHDVMLMLRAAARGMA